MTNEDVFDGIDVGGDAGDIDSGGSQIPVPTLHKKVEYMGNKNLNQEFNALESDVFDHLNYDEKVNYYGTIIGHLDTAIRNDMGATEEVLSVIRETTKNRQVANVNWNQKGGLWYGIYVEQVRIVNNMAGIISYKDWQIRYLIALLNKLRKVLASVRGASEEKIVVNTMKEFMKEQMEDIRKARTEEYERFQQMLHSQQQQSRDTVTNIEKSFQGLLNQVMSVNSGRRDYPSQPHSTQSLPPSVSSLAQKIGDIKETAKEKPKPEKTPLETQQIEDMIKDYVRSNPGENRMKIANAVLKEHNIGRGDSLKLIKEMLDSGILRFEETGNKNRNPIYLAGG